jgi:flagellar FliL protein
MTVTAIPNAPEVADAKAKGKGKDKAKGGKKKLIMIIVGVLVFGGGGYYMFLKPKPVGPPVPGEVMKLDAIQINLADNHYLRIAISLQLVKGVKEADGSKAQDAAITVFSGLPMSEVNDPKHRELLRTELVKQLKERYEGGVMGVYFTELVTQ